MDGWMDVHGTRGLNLEVCLMNTDDTNSGTAGSSAKSAKSKAGVQERSEEAKAHTLRRKGAEQPKPTPAGADPPKPTNNLVGRGLMFSN
jgi:hypothetical protein